jgi:hypothetical protein
VTDWSIASCALNSRIANKASNLILVPFGRLAEWLKLFTPLAAALGPCRHMSCIFRKAFSNELVVEEGDFALLVLSVIEFHKP